MSKSTCARRQALVAAVLLAVAVFGPVGSQPASSADPGIIAYVKRSTGDIHLISPDGTGDRRLWTNPGQSGINGMLCLTWRPDGRELAFTSQHEQVCSCYESDVFAIGTNGADYRRVTNAPAFQRAR